MQNVTYVVLHLKDERRIYGWPKIWPSFPDHGHFMLMQASWIVEKDEEPEEIKMEGVDFMLIDVKDVRWVEFMEKKWEAQNEKQSTTS